MVNVMVSCGDIPKDSGTGKCPVCGEPDCGEEQKEEANGNPIGNCIGTYHRKYCMSKPVTLDHPLVEK